MRFVHILLLVIVVSVFLVAWLEVKPELDAYDPARFPGIDQKAWKSRVHLAYWEKWGSFEAEACQSMGAEKLFAEVAAALGESAQVTLEPVYCLGNCALSPAAMIDGRLYGRMNADKALAELRK